MSRGGPRRGEKSSKVVKRRAKPVRALELMETGVAFVRAARLYVPAKSRELQKLLGQITECFLLGIEALGEDRPAEPEHPGQGKLKG